MRNELKISLIAACLAASIFAGAAEPVPAEIKEAMAKFEKALRWNSPGVLRNLIYEYSTPDYTSWMSGHKYDLYGEIDNIAMFGKAVQKVYSAKSKIESYKWHGPLIDVNYSLAGEMLVTMGGPPQRMRMYSLSKSTWTKAYGSWKMLSQEALKETMVPVKGRRAKKH